MDDDDPRHNEAMVAAQARMYAPLVWSTTPDFEIQSLKDTRYAEALNLIKHHYAKEEPMCTSINMSQDYESVKCFLDMALTWMKDTISLCALSTRTDRMVGVAVMRLNSLVDKSEVYHRVQVLKGEALPKIMHLRGTLLKQAKIYETFGIEEYLKIFLLAVHPSYEEKEVRSGLVDAVISVCRSLKSPAVFGIFTSKIDQEVADGLNFKMLSEIQYSQWIIDDEVVFDDPGIGNYSAALMGILVSDKEPEEHPKRRKNTTGKRDGRKTGKSSCQ